MSDEYKDVVKVLEEVDGKPVFIALGKEEREAIEAWIDTEFEQEETEAVPDEQGQEIPSVDE